MVTETMKILPGLGLKHAPNLTKTFFNVFETTKRGEYFNRPGVAGPVLQTPWSLINFLIQSVIFFLQTFKISLHPNRKI